MNDKIIVALIGLFGVLIGHLISYFTTSKKEKIKSAVYKQKLADELREIKEKLDLHNKYAEKFGAIQKSINKIEKENISIRKDIEFLKDNKC